jgi:hypothetical protein
MDEHHTAEKDAVLAERERIADQCRKWAVERFDQFGGRDARGAALWDVATWLQPDPLVAMRRTVRYAAYDRPTLDRAAEPRRLCRVQQSARGERPMTAEKAHISVRLLEFADRLSHKTCDRYIQAKPLGPHLPGWGLLQVAQWHLCNAYERAAGFDADVSNPPGPGADQ